MKKRKFIVLVIIMVTSWLSIQRLASQSTLEISIERGEGVYMNYCTSCHLVSGEGIPGVFPPLANADYLIGNRTNAIRAVKKGMEGEVTVNGMTYNNIMYSMGLDDQQVVDVMNYILNSWGNTGAEVTLAEVKPIE